MKIHKETLPEHSYKLLEEIHISNDFADFYLAGGTALALQIGHRKSVDLDFFSVNEFKSSLVNNLLQNKKHKVISLQSNSIELIIEGTKVFFFNFAFPLYRDIVVLESLNLASPVDIGLMKLLALQGRTSRKDIIDLYFIDQKVIKLEKLLHLFEQHYPKESFNSYNSFKSLLDLSDLEKEPMPRMLVGVKWDKMLELVSRKLKAHLKEILN